jgi:CRP-like cAMP-binding protein
MVGVHVPDDDPCQLPCVRESTEAVGDAMPDIEEDGRVGELDEEPRRRRVGVGESGAAPEDCQPHAVGHSRHWGILRPGRGSRPPSTRPPACRRADKIGRETMGAPFARAYDAPEMRSLSPLVESLALIPFFAGLDQGALERVAAGTRTRRFRRGEVIFHAGDPGDALFIIVSGEVKIALPSETGDEAIIASLRPGDVFGELALLDGAARSATASALAVTEAVVLPRDRFRELVATEPAVRDALLASLAAELRRLTVHVEELHFLDMTGRVAARLVRLAEESGPARDDGIVRLRSSLTQGELASMVGCTRQSVNKLLGQFADEGFVRLDREGIAIIDLPGLVAASRR